MSTLEERIEQAQELGRQRWNRMVKSEEAEYAAQLERDRAGQDADRSSLRIVRESDSE